MSNPNELASTSAFAPFLAVMLTIMAAIPVYVLSALAPMIRADIGFSVAGLGGLVTISMVVAGAASIAVGSVIERLRIRRASMLAAGLSTLSLGGLFLATSWLVMAAAIIVAGCALTTAHLAANLVIARSVRLRKQGIAFGIKQAAVPGALGVAGLMVPLAEGPFGWRLVLGILATAALALVVACYYLPDIDGSTVDSRKRGDAVVPRSRRSALIVLGLGCIAAGSAISSMSTFLVETGVSYGLPIDRAGAVLAAGSIGAVAARVVAGWLADRRLSGHLKAVVKMMSVGAVSFLLVGIGPGRSWFIIGAIVGCTFGWGWNGLLHYSVIHYNRDVPAAASSFVQTGLYMGAGLGPLGFGLLASAASYRLAWIIAAGALGVAIGLVLTSRKMMIVALQAQTDGRPGMTLRTPGESPRG